MEASSFARRRPSPVVASRESSAGGAGLPPTPQQSPPYQSSPTVRHAGRAHIRGKIRRIWRPRYIELCDNGWVRYYELPTNTSTIRDDGDHVDMMPKDALHVFYARIIDVTTLRDLHVGLPKGSFGFLFQGQRILTRPLGAQNPNLPTTGVSTPHSTSSSSHLYTPLAASNNRSASPLIGLSYQQQETSHHSFNEALHLYSPTNSTNYPYNHHHQADLQQPDPPREYFCAVTTLEEAQTWVVALQWAASQQANHLMKQQQQRLPYASPQQPFQVVPDHVQFRTGGGSTTTRSIASSSHESLVVVSHTPSHPESGSTTTGGAVSTTPQTAPPSNNSSGRGGRIVVTKVTGSRLIKVPQVWQWEIAYEIALLLLPRHGTNDRTGTSSSLSKKNKTSPIQECTMLRTTAQLKSLLMNLQYELQDSKIALSVLEDWVQTIDTLPTWNKALLSMRAHPKRKGSTIPSLQRLLTQSFGVVDQLLRTVAMDPAMVNSVAFKEWFLLDWEHPPVEKVRWWRALSKNALVHSQTLILPPSSSRSSSTSAVVLDDYVKAWLVVTDYHMESERKMKFLQQPWMVLGGTGIILAMIVPSWQWYTLHVSPTMVSWRVDVLMASWILAFVLGAQYATHGRAMMATLKSRQQPPRHKTLKQRSHVKVERSGNRFSSTKTDENNQRQSENVLCTREEGLPPGENHEEDEDDEYLEEEEQVISLTPSRQKLSSPLPEYPDNHGETCWSIIADSQIFRVRGPTYLEDRVKVPSGSSPFCCQGVDIWLTDNPPRHIARHPAMLGGKLSTQKTDMFLVNFLLPFGNFVSYFSVPALDDFPSPQLAKVWSGFLSGDQQYRDARLKLLPVVMDGPWIVKAAVGNGTAPALLGKVIPLQYFFRQRSSTQGDTKQKPGLYEVDVIITASTIAKGILSVVKGHTKALTIGFAFIIEASEAFELPETVLCSFQIHSINLDDCPELPDCNLDEQ